jgi:hypothetical protein
MGPSGYNYNQLFDHTPKMILLGQDIDVFLSLWPQPRASRQKDARARKRESRFH